MGRLPCLDGWAAASVEELEGGSMLAYVGLLVLGYLVFSVATGVFTQALSAAIDEPLGGYWGGGWCLLAPNTLISARYKRPVDVMLFLRYSHMQVL